jgi:hypothetical protein
MLMVMRAVEMSKEAPLYPMDYQIVTEMRLELEDAI